MGLFSRFTFNQPRGSGLHSSGIAGDDSRIGATSPESFEQRQRIESNRQYIAGYRDAQVVHNPSRSVRSQEDNATSNQESHARRRPLPRTSKIEHQSTSRIDHPRTSKIEVLPRPDSRSFSEPNSRPYNPYQ